MPTTGTTRRAPGRFWSWAILALVLIAHAVLSFRLFPSWGALTDGEQPVIVSDHAIHLYHGALGARFAREQATTWGFDPFFMAGYPETPVWDSSSNLSIAFQFAAGGRYSPRAYKLGLFACTLLAVAVLPAGAFAAGLGRAEAAATGALGLVVFWAGMPLVLWRTGLFAFVAASAALGAFLGLILRFDRRPSPGRWWAVASAGAALLFVHVTAPVLISGAAVGYAGAVARRWQDRRRRLVALTIGAAAAVAVNAFWLVPLWRFRGIRTGAFPFLTPDSPWYVWSFLWNNPVDGRLVLALLGLGLGGLAAWWAEGERCRALVFGGAAAVFLGLCAFGGSWSVTRSLEPFRFFASLALLLTVPAGSGLARAADWISRLAGGGRRGAALAVSAGAAAVVAAGFASPETVLLTARRLAQDRPLVVGLRPADRALVRWLKAETDVSARVLFEDQLRLLESTDVESTHWTPLLPILLGPEGRAFLGGLYQTAFIAHHKAASFGDYVLGGRRIDAWTPAEFSDYCDRYNVGWVVCWSPLSRFCVDRLPTARRLTTLPRPATPGREIMPDATQWRAIAALAGRQVADRYLSEGVNRYQVYRVDRPHSYFLQGRGLVTSFAPNRVVLSHLTADPTGSAVLSLHWLDTWKTAPPLPLSPFPVPGDPVPFVRINLERPVSRVVLYNGY